MSDPGWIDAGALKPSVPLPGFPPEVVATAITETLAAQNVCLALSSIWWGWGHEQRVSWVKTAPSWPLIFSVGGDW